MIRFDRELLKGELDGVIKLDKSQSRATAVYLAMVKAIGVLARHCANATDHLAYVQETDTAQLKSENAKLQQRLSALTKRVNALEKRNGLSS